MSKSLMSDFANRFGLEPEKMLTTLKATAFKGDVSNEQMAALVVVANQYGLNPFTREIYAYPDRGGIVPVVGVDGWARIVNENPSFDGMDFEQDAESATCRIYRKDRAHPVCVTEFMSECKRSTQPWKSHPRRMLRHKAFIQCARMAFAYTGIFDDDEAQAIVEKPEEKIAVPVELPFYSGEAVANNLENWKQLIDNGSRSAADIVSAIESKYQLEDDDKTLILDLEIGVNENG